MILETSLVASVKDYGEFTLKTCFNNPDGYIAFPHSGYDYEIEEKLGKLTFEPEKYEEEEFIEQLFNFYISKSK